MESDIELLTVLSLERAERVHCQAPDCRKTIYRRIHVVRDKTGLSFYGSECFKKLLGEYSKKPSYGDWGDRVLTPAERESLLMNTERFLAFLQARYNNTEHGQPQAITKPTLPPVPPQAPSSPPTGYGESRTLMCIGCGNVFESRERLCTTCRTRDTVFTWK